jgi:phosphonate transport system permease protein
VQSSLPENLIKIENNLKSLTRTRSIYSFLSIAALIAVIYSGLIVAETGNATSIWVGLPKFFDYPVDLFVGSWEYFNRKKKIYI